MYRPRMSIAALTLLALLLPSTTATPDPQPVRRESDFAAQRRRERERRKNDWCLHSDLITTPHDTVAEESRRVKARQPYGPQPSKYQRQQPVKNHQCRPRGRGR